VFIEGQDAKAGDLQDQFAPLPFQAQIDYDAAQLAYTTAVDRTGVRLIDAAAATSCG
jgi:hypothetical protein